MVNRSYANIYQVYILQHFKSNRIAQNNNFLRMYCCVSRLKIKQAGFISETEVGQTTDDNISCAQQTARPAVPS